MRRPERKAVAAVAAFAGLLLAIPAVASTMPSAAASTAVTVDDATIRWGVNNETNNRAFEPNTYNFLSAGKVPNPGRGNQTIRPADWRQASGNVRVEKWNGSAWQPATWAGLSTDSSGNALGSPTAGTFSNHNFVISGGTGTVDRAAGTAHVEWAGDLTVVYYSGKSFFYLSNPVLDVADGAGTLTATVSGYASSIDDPTIWAPIAPRTVTVADLPDVDLADESGFVAAPAYLGVRVTGVPQNTSGPSTGSFPQSWINTMDQLGTAAFWYSSGAGTDSFKVPLPMTVGYDASVPVTSEPTPTVAPTKPAPSNPVIESPKPTRTPTPTGSATPTATATATATASVASTAAPGAPVAAPPAVAMPPIASDSAAAAPVAVPARPATEVALAAAPTTSRGDDDGGASSLPWWIGAGCLLAAAVLFLLPVGGSGPGSRITTK